MLLRVFIIGSISSFIEVSSEPENKSEIEKLKEELLKKEIEMMRLKKGYMVKGVGAKKEYVSISDVNIK